MKLLLCTALVLISFSAISKRAPFVGDRYLQLTGKKPNKSKKYFWNKTYDHSKYIYRKTPTRFLAENFHYVPVGAKVLDMGMGEGRNAVFLARQGYKVTGVDISSVAVNKANKLAEEFSVNVNSIVASLKTYNIPEESFDAIICFYWVDYSMIEKIEKWLKPGGVLIYEAFTTNQLRLKNNKFLDASNLLRPQELLNLFKGFSVLKYEEPLHRKEFTASVILRKNK